MKKFAIQLLLFSALTLLLPVATAALCGGTPGDQRLYDLPLPVRPN